MTTRRSFSDFSLSRTMPFVKNTIRDRRGVLVFYWIMAFLTLPVQYGVEIYQYYTNYINTTVIERPWHVRMLSALGGPAECYNEISLVFFMAIIMIVPVILSLALNSYMHNRRMVDVYHSLPMTREELFVGNAIAACFIMWLPLVVNFAMVAVMAAFVPGASILAIFGELLFNMVMMLAIYSLTSFVATQVGTSLDQTLFTAVFVFSLFGVFLVLEQMAGTYLYGYRTLDSHYEMAYLLSPFVMIIRRLTFSAAGDYAYFLGREIDIDEAASWFVINNWAAVVWLILSVLIIAVSAHLYKRRKSEQAEVIGNLAPLQIYTRAIGTLGAGTIFGVVICEVFGLANSGVSMTASIAFGSIIAYYIGDIILTHLVRRPKEVLPAGLATVLVVCIVVGSVIFDFFGFEKRVPAADNVESITIYNSRFRYSEQGWYKTGKYGVITVTNPEAIENIIAIHSLQLAQDERENNSFGSMRISYELKNGRKLERQYHGFNEESFMRFAELEVNDELLTNTAAIFRMEPSDVVSVSFENALGSRENTIVLTEGEKARIIEAVRTDLLNQPVEELTEGAKAIGIINFEVPDLEYYEDTQIYYGAYVDGPVAVYETKSDRMKTSWMSYAVTESFVNTIAALKDAGAVYLMENDVSDIDTIRLWLYNRNGYSYSIMSYAFPNNTPSTAWEYNVDKYDEQVWPFCEITADELERIEYLTSYYPSTKESVEQSVAVLYYTDNSTEPCGWHYTDINALPRDLLERTAKAYYDTHNTLPEAVRELGIEF